MSPFYCMTGMTNLMVAKWHIHLAKIAHVALEQTIHTESFLLIPMTMVEGGQVAPVVMSLSTSFSSMKTLPYIQGI